jgi:Delta3-Delta2-enoyl-CoA isomerase
LESDEKIRGVIITSDLQKIFSAGLDLKEFYKTNEEKFTKFWKSFQNLFYVLYSTPLILIAAINGACPAGGCKFFFY